MTVRHSGAAVAALTLVGALASAGPAVAGGRATTVSCGQTLTQSVKLANELRNCPADGLVIGADGITVDLNDHTVDGVAAPVTDCRTAPRDTTGIRNGGGSSRVFDRLTIKNGTLQQFRLGYNAGSETDGMADSRLRNLTVRANTIGGLDMGSGGLFTNHNRVEHNLVTGTQCGAGIVVNSSDGSVVTHNNVRGGQDGILLCCSINSAVRDNRTAHNAGDGIAVCCDGRDNVVEHNESVDNVNNGILVFFGTNGTRVRGNHVAHNGDDIVVDDGTGNSIANNLVTDALGCPFCDPPTGFGIVIVGDAHDNLIAGNAVARTKDDGIAVLDFDPNDPGNPVPEGTTIRGNFVRAAADDGIGLDSAAAVLTRNGAFSNHDLGIDAPEGVTDGGGNRAAGNGNPAQCTGVVCH